QDRNLRQIDFLLTRKHQQQVEWAFEAFHIDDHGRFGCATVGADRGVKLLAAHDPAFRCGSSATICVNILRADSISNCSGPTRAASAAPERSCPTPERSRAP